MLRAVDTYYIDKPEPAKSTLLTLREIILDTDSDVSETIKWHIPCFSYKKKIFCFLNIEKKSGDPYILLSEGRNMNHPLLERGDRTRMKILRVNPEHDIPIDSIHSILSDALALCKK